MRREGRRGITPLVVTSLPMLPRAAAFDLKTNTIITTTTAPLIDIDAWITTEYKCEWLVIVLVVLLLGLAIVVAWALSKLTRLRRRTSHVFFQISTADDLYLLRYIKLPDASRAYTLFTGGANTMLEIIDLGIFGILKFKITPGTIQYDITNEILPPKTWIMVGPRQSRRVKALLTKTTTVRPLLVHCHEYSANHPLMSYRPGCENESQV